MMIDVDYVDLILGSSVYYDGIPVVPVTLGDIKRIGYQKYISYCNLICMTKNDLSKIFGEEIELSPSATLFSAFFYIKDMREFLKEALSFFVSSDITANINKVSFDGGDFSINNSNYIGLCETIKKVNALSSTDEDDIEELKFANKRAREVYEKAQKAKKKAKQDGKPIRFHDMISGVCTQHNSYNLTNIYDLTIYQLYDQFVRLSIKTEVDAIIPRWAAYGTEPFDFSIWYQSNKN